jgi:hypothetical protein
VILLISASWVARITDVSHWYPTWRCSVPTVLYPLKGLLESGIDY